MYKSHKEKIAAIVVLLMLLYAGIAVAQPPVPSTTPAQPTITVPSPTETPTLAPSATDNFISFDQALTVYKDISQQVIQSSTQTVEFAKWILGVLGGLAAVAVAAITYISAKTRAAENAAQRSAAEAEKSRQKLEKLEKQIAASLRRLRTADQAVKKINNELKHIQPANIAQLEMLSTVHIYEINLYDADDMKRRIARDTLIEYSRDPNPVVRLECVRVLGNLLLPSSSKDAGTDSLVERFREIARDDTSQLIRAEADRRLKGFGSGNPS